MTTRLFLFKEACLLVAALVVISTELSAQNARIDSSYNALSGQLGGSMPTGAGVAVTQVESPETGSSRYAPTSGNPEFAGKTITILSGTFADSSHGTDVGRFLYGSTTSLAPGITTIEVYSTSTTTNYFSGVLRMGSPLGPIINYSASKVTNHSYVGAYAAANDNLEADMRLDYQIAQSDRVNVVGVNNGTNPNGALFTSSMNAISVGVSSGFHMTGSVPVTGNAIYNAVHPRPDIVAAAQVSGASYATPTVGSAIATLVSASASNPGWSLNNASYNSGANLVRAAETSEVLKATVMAGATRSYSQVNTGVVYDYRAIPFNQTVNGLDRRYGAGMLNLRNSYEILAAGQRRSLEDSAGPDVGVTGFDYDNDFGGTSSNSTGTYEFVGSWTGQNFAASLAWNVKIDVSKVVNLPSRDFANAATLHDLNLRLYDITGGGNTLIASSLSTTENTENLNTTLTAGNRYRLEVTKVGSNFAWDYGLAWNGSSNMLWTGSVNSTWDNGLTSNWQRGAGSNVFRENDQVVFNDVATNTNVTLTGSLTPDTITFTNSSKNYSLNGASLTSNLFLSKSGTGSVTLNQVNTFSGEAIISQGTLRNGINQAFSSNAILNLSTTNATYDLNGFAQTLTYVYGPGKILLNGGTLTASNINSYEFNGTIQGSGTLNKQATNLWALTGSMLWGNNVTINVQAGQLGLNLDASDSVTVGTNMNVFVAANGTLQLYGSKSALAETGGNRARIITQDFLAGVTIIGTNQVTGRISGPVQVAQPLGTAVGQTTLNSNAQLEAAGLRQNVLTMQAGSSLTITPNGSANNMVVLNNTTAGGTSALVMDPTATLNLTDNDLVLYYNTPLGNSVLRQTIDNYVRNGLNNLPGPKFTSTPNLSGLTTLGVVDNSLLLTGDLQMAETFGDLTLGNTALAPNSSGYGFNQILVKYTYYGDSNLDGFVTDDDLGYFLAGYGQAGVGWLFGDYNYDGFVTDDDLGYFLAGYSQSPGLSAGPDITPLPMINAIPEPSTWGLLTLLGIVGGYYYRVRRPTCHAATF